MVAWELVELAWAEEGADLGYARSATRPEASMLKRRTHNRSRRDLDFSTRVSNIRDMKK